MKQLMNHPLLVAIIAALIGASIPGLLALRGAWIQADATVAAAQVQKETQLLLEKQRQLMEKPPEPPAPPNPMHSITINYSGLHSFTVSSLFQETADYGVRHEGCYYITTDAICAFTITPKKTITVTNLENFSHASRRDGSEITTCCLFSNDSSEGYHIVKDNNRSDAAVIRTTFSPPESRLFFVKIPNYSVGGSLDSIVFSRGQRDPGVEFPITLKAFEDVPKPSKSIASLRASLDNDPADGVLGNPKGKITMVEFVDYACPVCKTAEPALQAILKANPDVRLVVKEFPILDGENAQPISTESALAALAAARQGKYGKVHDAFLRSRKLTEQDILRTLAENGLRTLGISALNSDKSSVEHIGENKKLAEEIGVTGSPEFVLNNTLLEFEPETLTGQINVARANLPSE